jgi:amino acid transporter
VYPALFTQYLSHWLPGMTPLSRWLVALAFIWILTGLNIRGVRLVGRGAIVLGVLALAPILALVITGAGRIQFAPWEPFTGEGDSLVQNLGLGLAVVMWNYSGWDTPTTCLGETRNPERAFRRALALSLPLITFAYVLFRSGRKSGNCRFFVFFDRMRFMRCRVWSYPQAAAACVFLAWRGPAWVRQARMVFMR